MTCTVRIGLLQSSIFFIINKKTKTNPNKAKNELKTNKVNKTLSSNERTVEGSCLVPEAGSNMMDNYNDSTGEADNIKSQLNLALEKSISGCWAMNLQREKISESQMRQHVVTKARNQNHFIINSGYDLYSLTSDMTFLKFYK